MVFKNVFVPEKETVAQVEDNVRNMIDAMGLSKVKQDDKAHRLGKIKEINGKKTPRRHRPF